LLEYNPETQQFSVLVDSFNGQPLQGLNDLTIDSQGGIYFTVMGPSSIQKPIGRVFYLAPNSQQPQLLASDLAFPNGLALSPDEKTIAVAEFAAKRILSLPSATAKGGMPLAYVLAYTEGGVGPDGLLYDQNSQLYAANLGTGEVLVYAPSGKLLGALELPEAAGDLVTNLAITKDKIYVTESGKNEVWSIDYPAIDCLK
jgi:sugar lactone lactonase YvrE